MRTGDSAARQARRPTTTGFTYLWLLFVIAIGSAGLAALGQRWQTAVQRDREIEMAFRAGQIADAIAHYRAQSPEGAPTLPKSLSELLDDRRSGASRRHLRRLYTDPFTGAADWVLLTDEQGGIVGLHSASGLPALITRNLPAGAPANLRAPLRVSDRVFMAGTARKPIAAATAPTGAASGTDLPTDADAPLPSE